MSININYSKTASKNLITGVKKVYDIIKRTIGPKGDNVIISPSLQITNDGLEIAKTITLSNEFENIGARLVAKLAEDVKEEAFDGSKQAIILLANILFKAEKYINRGYDIDRLINSFSNIQNIINEYFTQQTIETTNTNESQKVLSSNNTTNNNNVLQLNSGAITYQMLSDFNSQKTILENPIVLLLNDNRDLPQILNSISTPTLLMSSSYTDENISLMNKFLAHSDHKVVATLLNENNISTLAKFCNFENKNGNLVGQVDRVIVSSNRTTLINNLNSNEIFNNSLYQFNAQNNNLINNTNVILGEGIGLLQLQEYLQTQKLLSYDDLARNIISGALDMPYLLILDNAGIVSQSMQPYDFQQNKFVTREKFTIYDSIDVIKTVLNLVIDYLPIFLRRNIIINTI
ncbi:MAG TPA: hypothetical protein GXZ48_01555 [Acholeplasmataceae bacterium]|nr:hypothetical protein [Acholeplasmataceae bacterium]